jgi:hypothetical protein
LARLERESEEEAKRHQDEEARIANKMKRVHDKLEKIKEVCVCVCMSISSCTFEMCVLTAKYGR